jgi:serine/threonine-protein kinase
MEIPEDLDNVILACLEKDPADRPQGADELASRLRNITFEHSWNQERAQAWWTLHHTG